MANIPSDVVKRMKERLRRASKAERLAFNRAYIWKPDNPANGEWAGAPAGSDHAGPDSPVPDVRGSFENTLYYERDMIAAGV